MYSNGEEVPGRLLVESCRKGDDHGINHEREAGRYPAIGAQLQPSGQKAQVWVFEALKGMADRLPFALLGIDSDNGSEFLNAHLLRFCQQKEITFTRSRPYRKNDNCFVEQKNYSVVRRAVGYRRYDMEEELLVLNELYESLRLFTNFFQPAMKLTEKRSCKGR